MDRFLEEIVVKKNRTVNEILFVLSMVVMILTALYAVMMLQMLFYAFSVPERRPSSCPPPYSSGETRKSL